MVSSRSEAIAGDRIEVLEVLEFGSGSRGFRSHLCRFLAVCSQESHFPSQSFSFSCIKRLRRVIVKVEWDYMSHLVWHLS